MMSEKAANVQRKNVKDYKNVWLLGSKYEEMRA